MKKKQRRVKRPRGEIKQRFDEQLSYLSFAADGYDTQDHSLIKMATAPLRTLFLKQNMGEPLIEQLKIDPEKRSLCLLWLWEKEWCFTVVQ